MNYRFEQFSEKTNIELKELIQLEQSDVKKKLTELSFETLMKLDLLGFKNTISMFKLPISFSAYSLLAISLFKKGADGEMTVLGDCLDQFEGQEVTVERILELYPNGFYDEESLKMRAKEIVGTPQNRGRWANLFIPNSYLELELKQLIESRKNKTKYRKTTGRLRIGKLSYAKKN